MQALLKLPIGLIFACSMIEQRPPHGLVKDYFFFFLNPHLLSLGDWPHVGCYILSMLPFGL